MAQATQDTATQGMTFDSAPVKQDMPVGMTFDSAPVKQDTAIDTASQPASDSQQQLSGDQWFHGSDSPEAIAAAKAQNPPMRQLKEAGIGALKSAGQTGSLILDYLGGGPSAVAMHAAGIESPNREKLDNALEIHGENEKGGSMVEQLAEFMLLDLGAAKGIAATSKLGMVQDALKLAEKYQPVAKLLHAGMTFLQQGSTATGVGLLHGEDLPTAAKQGAAVGAFGGTLEGVASLAPDVIAGVKSAAKRLSAESIQPSLQKGIRDVVSKAAEQSGAAASDTDNFHQALQELGNGNEFSDLPVQDQSRVLQRAQAIKASNGGPAPLPISEQAKAAFEIALRSKRPIVPGRDPLLEAVLGRDVAQGPTADSYAKEITTRRPVSGSAVNAKPPASIRDVVEDAADEVYGRSKGLYAQLDQATGGQFQRFDDELQNINRKLRETAGLDDEKEAELLKKKADVEAAQQKVFSDAKAKGVDPRLVEQAKANYRRAQALYDLDLNVKKSVSGMRPDVGDAKQAAKNPETVDPKKLFARVNGLYDSGRLQEALGEQGADDLLAHANEHFIRHKVILRNQAIAKTVGKAAGYGLAGAAGGTAVTHLIQ